jgi:hypothetical protein
MGFDAVPTHADAVADRASRSIAPRRRIGRWPCALSLRRGETRIRAVGKGEDEIGSRKFKTLKSRGFVR